MFFDYRNKLFVLKTFVFYSRNKHFPSPPITISITEAHETFVFHSQNKRFVAELVCFWGGAGEGSSWRQEKQTRWTRLHFECARFPRPCFSDPRDLQCAFIRAIASPSKDGHECISSAHACRLCCSQADAFQTVEISRPSRPWQVRVREIQCRFRPTDNYEEILPSERALETATAVGP